MQRSSETIATLAAALAKAQAELSTPEQKCIGSPKQKYINDSGKKAPHMGPFLQA